MSGIDWMLEEFERAKKRSAQVPTWAKPIVCKASPWKVRNRLTDERDVE